MGKFHSNMNVRKKTKMGHAYTHTHIHTRMCTFNKYLTTRDTEMPNETQKDAKYHGYSGKLLIKAIMRCHYITHRTA